MVIADAIIRGAGIGLALFLCIVLARAGLHRSFVRFGILFGVGVASYLICSALWFADLPAGPRFPLLLLCMINPLLFWLFARSLFNDDFALTGTEKGVIAAFLSLIALRLVARTDETTLFADSTGTVLQMAGLALVLHILFEVAQGRGADLLESRRRFRVAASAAIAVYMVIIVLAELVLQGAAPPQFLTTLNAAAILGLAAGVLFFLTQAREELIPPVPQTATTGNETASTSTNEPVDQALIDAIDRAMAEEKLYRTEGLTVPGLAEALSTQEYILRRAINQSLGYRNFTAFLNAYRLPEVATALADPENQTPILTLAIDAGYSSIGPFNRAFKQAYGMTPSEYRNAAAKK